MDKLLALIRSGVRQSSSYHVPSVPGIVVKLDANESPYTFSDEIRQALASELAVVDVNRYPDPSASQLRALIADEYGVSGDSIVFGNGSDEIITTLVSCVGACRQGRERPSVLVPTPTFSVFKIAATSVGTDCIEVPLCDDFSLDMAALRRDITAVQPNIVFFARPNNPTGTLWPASCVRELCSEFSETLFVSDEAYGEYATGSMVADLASTPNLVVMKTLSKIGLAGLRIGFAIADPRLVAELEKVRAPYNLSSLNQRAAVFLLQQCRDLMREQCKQIISERTRMMEALASDSRFCVYPSDANLILFRVGVAGQGDAQRLWTALCEAGVLVRSFGDTGPLADCLRVSIGTTTDNDQFLSALGHG